LAINKKLFILKIENLGGEVMDWKKIIDKDWPAIVISEKKTLLNSQLIWTDEEWEKYRQQVLNTPLP